LDPSGAAREIVARLTNSENVLDLGGFIRSTGLGEGSRDVASAAQRGIRGIRARALLLTGAAVVALVLAGSVVGADSITPANSTLNLGVGSSATLHQTLHLDAAPARADVILALDTTGSMGAAITDAKNDANDIVNGIKTSIPGAKFSVAEFKDYGDTLNGVTGGTPWRVVQDFTDNVGTIPCGNAELSPVECALSQLSAAGGGDEPEAYNTAFYEAYSDPALHFTTGVDEQKEKNLEHNPHCAITTGCNTFEGLDVVVEADAIVEADPARLQALADAYRAKYGDLFDFELRDGGFRVKGEEADGLVYRLKATKAFGFAKGPFSQTRWRFDS